MASTLIPPGPVAGKSAQSQVGATVALPPGTTLGEGRYELDEVLGRGGFGITYAAVDRRLERPVAIKELFPDGAHRRGRDVAVAATAAHGFALARERFLREATTLARFGHPGIVRIWGALEENATAYLVLERLQGRTLAQELRARRGPFTEAEALDVAGQVAEALAVIHRAGVLHRDVSPANLVRTDDGRVVLIDFGLARPFAMDRTTAMTRIVTPGYSSPEQHEGLARFGPRSDVYALGATLYRLVTGRIPPGAGDRARRDVLVPAWRLNPSVSRPVSDALAAALAVEVDRRPPTVEALLARLGLESVEEVVEPATVVEPVTVVERPTEPEPEPEPAPVPAPVRPAGAPPRRRGWVTVPLGLAAVALASAQPVTVTAVLALVVAPVLATVGDGLIRPHRSLAWAPGWWLRNVAVGLVRSFGAACLLGVGLCLWYGTEAFAGLAGAGPWVLRATGVGTGWVLASSMGRGGLGFRSHVALDALAGRLWPRGRPTLAAGVLLLACLGGGAAGLWFQPEAWPLGG